MTRFAESLGLTIVPPLLADISVRAADRGPFCFLSVVPIDQLHPYGDPAVRLSDATDPLIGFKRSYYKAPYLVAGHLHWSDDTPDYSRITKPYFVNLKRWIEQGWEAGEGDFFVGPSAKELVHSGAELVNLLPGSIAVEVVES